MEEDSDKVPDSIVPRSCIVGAITWNFLPCYRASVSLTSGFHPQSNSQAERANKKMESSLCCLVSSNPTTWATQLPWVEYAHNTLRTSVTGLSPFQCLYGFQSPLFPSQERDVAVPSVQVYIKRCHRTWCLLAPSPHIPA